MLIIIVNNISTNYQRFNQSNAHLFFEGFSDEYISLPPDSTTLVVDHWFQFLAFQEINRLREDISVITLSDLILPEYFNPITRERFPGVHMPDERAKIETDLHRVAYFILENADNPKRPLFMADGPLVINFYPNLLPTGTFFYLVTSEPHSSVSKLLIDKNINNIIRKVSNDFTQYPQCQKQLEQYYIGFILHHTYYLKVFGYSSEALYLYKSIEPFFWGYDKKISPIVLDSYFANEYGILYSDHHNYGKAKQLLFRALRQSPDLFEIWLNFGLVLQRTGKWNESLQALTQAETLQPDNPRLQFEIGNVNQHLGNNKEAIRHYLLSIKSPAYDSIKSVAKSRLKALKASTN